MRIYKKRKKATKQLDMQTTTSHCINKQLVTVCQNQTDESSPNEQIISESERLLCCSRVVGVILAAVNVLYCLWL